jgi:hypothetical protein
MMQDRCGVVVRAMVALENVSRKPEDRFVNVFHFAGDKEGQNGQDIVDALTSFYVEPLEVGGVPISGFLSEYVVRAAPQPHQIHLYDLADPTPRAPRSFPLVLAVTESPDPLPNEVAVTLSFYADRNIPRHRGRIYFGPLNRNAAQEGTSDMRTGGGLRIALSGAAARMAAEGPAEWQVFSPTDGVARTITAGWVDDALDTQRRRGADPTGRTVFPTPLG